MSMMSHGTNSCYSTGCRESECTTAHADYTRLRRALNQLQAQDRPQIRADVLDLLAADTEIEARQLVNTWQPLRLRDAVTALARLVDVDRITASQIAAA